MLAAKLGAGQRSLYRKRKAVAYGFRSPFDSYLRTFHVGYRPIWLEKLDGFPNRS
jgi:hypothetical protein